MNVRGATRIAVARKPEYPVQFMRECRASYFALAQLLRTPAVVPPLPLQEANSAVATAMLDLLRELQREESSRAEAPAA